MANELINEGMKNIIEKNALGIASIDKSGNPHNIALGYIKVVSSNQLLVSDNYIIETIENIKKNPNVALVVWTRNWEEQCIGYELKGKAEYFTGGKWLESIKKIPENKDAPCKGAILITINKIKVLS